MVVVVAIALLHAGDVLHLLAAADVITHLAGTRDVIGIMTDVTGIVTVTVNVNANASDLAALKIVIKISKKTVTDMMTETAVKTIARMPQTETTEKLWTRYHQATMSLTQPSKLIERGCVVVVR